jgi:uncharacterized membrane protein (DUF2068 family)
MDILILSLVSAPFLVGMGLLILGLRRMRHLQARGAEIEQDFAAIYWLMMPGCLLVASFFPAVLVAIHLPLPVQAGIVGGLGCLLIVLGEWHIRSAVIYKHDVTPGAPWLAFLGICSPALYLPVWIRLLEPFIMLYVACLFIALPLGQYLLIRRWRHVRSKMLRTLEDQ